MPMGEPYKCYLERSYHRFERKGGAEFARQSLSGLLQGLLIDSLLGRDLDRTHSPLPTRAINLIPSKQDSILTECRLTFLVNGEIYRHIDTEALFHLKTQLRGSLSHGDFQPEANIEIEVTLQPELLSSLTNLDI